MNDFLNNIAPALQNLGTLTGQFGQAVNIAQNIQNTVQMLASSIGLSSVTTIGALIAVPFLSSH